MIRFKDKTIRYEGHVWTISGVITRRCVTLDMNRLYGDVTVGHKLMRAVRAMVDASPRYSRVFQ